MASGLPDYYRGMDVAYQALAEMTVRPKYGQVYLKSGSEPATPSGDTLLAFFSGKGMVYGGVIWLDYTSSQANSYIKLLLDAEHLNDLSFLRLNEYNITNPRSSVVTINKYDSVNHVYCVGISYGVTFDSYLMLLYYNAYANAPTIHYRLVYTLL